MPPIRRLRLASLAALALFFGSARASWAAEPQTRDLTVLGTTDVHGHVFPTSYYDDKEASLGLAKVYTLVKKFRAENPNTLLVDSGDMFQGSPLPYWQARVQHDRGPNPMVLAMNAMHYDVFGVGNHDFNFGLEHLQQAQKESHFPFISCNIYWTGTDRTLFKPYIIKEVAGVKVGVIGFSPPGIVIWDRANLKGRLEVRDLLKCARRWIPEMKAKGCDVIVAVPHSGLGGKYGPAYSGYSESSGLPPENVGIELAKAFPQIDVLFAGHSHQDVPHEVVNGVACTQAKLWGERMAVAQLHLEKAAGHWKVTTKSTDTLNVNGLEPAPEVTQAVRSAHQATIAYVHSPIARTSELWSSKDAYVRDTAIIDMINEVERQATGAQLAAASCFNPDATLGPGDITIADIAGLYPYENDLEGIRITGAKLKQYLEYSARFYQPLVPGQPVQFNPEVRAYNYDMVGGVTYRIDLSQPAGSRIRDLHYQGKPVADDQTFTMAINSYRAGGGGGFEMLRDCPVYYNHQESIRELIIHYLQEKKHIEPADVFTRNWELLPADSPH